MQCRAVSLQQPSFLYFKLSAAARSAATDSNDDTLSQSCGCQWSSSDWWQKSTLARYNAPASGLCGIAYRATSGRYSTCDRAVQSTAQRDVQQCNCVYTKDQSTRGHPCRPCCGVRSLYSNLAVEHFMHCASKLYLITVRCPIASLYAIGHVLDAGGQCPGVFPAGLQQCSAGA